MPSIEQVVSRFLFNQDTPPENLKYESLIRPNDENGDSLKVDIYEYMTESGGRYVDVALFRFVRNFLAGDDAAYPATMGKPRLKAGTYTLKDILKYYDIYGKDGDGAYRGIKQYYNGIYDANYAERCYVFGSTQFKINDGAVFKIDANNNRSIENIYVVPVTDNFDYKSTSLPAQITNFLTEDIIDPSGIGRTVPIEFINEDTWGAKSARTLTQDDLFSLQWTNHLHEISEYANIALIADNIGYFTAIFGALIEKLTLNGIISYQDENGNCVVYDGKDVDHNSFMDIDTAYYKQNFPTTLLFNKGFSVIGGGGNDTILGASWTRNELYGGKGDDVLVAEDHNDLLDGGEGDDRLISGKGNDTLRGGTGSDVYKFCGDFGNNVIEDEDGAGEIYIGGVKGEGSNIPVKFGGNKVGTLIKVAEGVYEDKEGYFRVYYSLDSGELVLESLIPEH